MGGIVGYLQTPAGNGIQNCYSTGDVSATNNVGGLVGYAYQGNIKNSFAMNENIKAVTSQGYRITGRVYSMSESGNMAFDDMVVTINGAARSIKPNNPAHTSQDGMNGTRATAMQNSSYLELIGWDFENIWQVAKDGNDYPALRNLNLLPPDQIIRVEGVSLDKKAQTIKLGEKTALKATITPANATNQELIWSSSNAAVAQAANDGVVTAKAVGSTTISVRTVSGNFSASCELTVVGASGAEDDPIQISTVQELKAMANGLDKHYVLTQDIDLGVDSDWKPIGRSTTPFTGSLDGKGYTIKNLRNISQTDYFGLFSYATDAKISNLKLEAVRN